MFKKKFIAKTESTFERYAPDVNLGLSSRDVEIRESVGATNSSPRKYSKSYLSIFCNNILTVFNLLGLIVLVALLCVKAPISNFFFVLFYIANISIGIIQEIRAKLTIEKLSLLAKKEVSVIRDGKKIKISSEKIVLDDIILLELGDQIPTDSILVQGSIKVNESLLTGESVPIRKNEGDVILAGSYITSGSCIVKAEKVGKDNYVQILSAKAKQYKKPNSEIMRSISLVIRVIGFLIVPLATAFMTKSMVIFKTSITEAILGTSTVVIGMIPSGMFLLVSVALAVGIIKLARQHTLVQDLYSLEMLARVDTICFDKTGTITDGKMCVTKILPLNDTSADEINSIISSMNYALNDTNSTAIALENHFGKEEKLPAKTKLNFSSDTKYSAVTFENCTYVLGAPEFVLDREKFSLISQNVLEYAHKGYRVLLLAKSSTPIDNDNIPKDLENVCLIIIADNVRSDACETVAWFKKNNVAIKVISGDNPITVSEVSKRVGIDNAEKFISLEGLSDQEVYDVANDYTVFGRVSPEQKAILIRALKDAGHVTAMTGDGVNDILALKEADCAISVASGSEAARNVSHLVLLKDNFNSMPKVVCEGRRVINNIERSSSLFLMKTFFTLFMSIIALTIPYMKTYPFKLPHMLLLEIFIIGLPSFFLSLQPNESIVQGKFIYEIFKKSFPGAVSMILNVIAIEILKIIFYNYPDQIFTTLSVAAITISGAFNLYLHCRPFNTYRTVLFTSSLFIVVTVLVFAIFEGLPLLELMPLGSFRNMPNPTIILGIMILANIPIGILMEKLFNRFNFDKMTKKIFTDNEKKSK